MKNVSIQFLSFYCLAKIGQKNVEFLNGDYHFRSSKWFTDSMHQEMLSVTLQIVIEITIEKKSIFSLCPHNIDKTI